MPDIPLIPEPDSKQRDARIDERMALFDELARLTRDPDQHADELRRLYADDRLRVPASVRNELRDRDESV